MTDLQTQIRSYFDDMNPPFDPADLIQDAEARPVSVSVPPRWADRRWLYATAALIATVVVIGLTAWLIGGSSDNAPPVITQLPPTTPPTTLLEPPPTSPEVADVFDYTTDDLCEFFTGEDILAIVGRAYAAAGVDYPIPSEIPAFGVGDSPGCEWTMGQPGGWGTYDFTVDLKDESNYRFADGATAIDSYHRGDYREDALHASEVYGIADLVPDGVVFLGGFSPGFNVYVEKTDRILDFRHDLAASVQPQDQWDSYWDDTITITDKGRTRFGIDIRILTEMLQRMNWLPDASQ